MCAPIESSSLRGVALLPEARQPFALLIEEKPICRLAIGQVVAEAVRLERMQAVGRLTEAAAILAAEAPALLLIDLFSINYDFKGLARLLSAAEPVPTIAIDDRLNPAFVQLAQDAGARGYVSKDFDLIQFKAALASVFGGGGHFPGRPPQRASRTGAILSPRQLDVLKQLAVGRRNREIAELLGISAGTVKLHIHAILRLTGARNRTEAALLAGRFLAPNSEH